MYARLLGFLPIFLLEPGPELPEGPGPVGVFVLVLAHLGVREMSPLRHEDGIPPEPPLPPRFGRDLALYHPLEDVHGPMRIRQRKRTHSARSRVTAAEHLDDSLVADAT